VDRARTHADVLQTAGMPLAPIDGSQETTRLSRGGAGSGLVGGRRRGGRGAGVGGAREAGGGPRPTFFPKRLAGLTSPIHSRYATRDPSWRRLGGPGSRRVILLPEPAELLRAALEKVVFFEWRVSELTAELTASQSRLANAELARAEAEDEARAATGLVKAARMQCAELETERTRLAALLAQPGARALQGRLSSSPGGAAAVRLPGSRARERAGRTGAFPRGTRALAHRDGRAGPDRRRSARRAGPVHQRVAR